MTNSLSNKPFAVVTGASSGIGFELAKELGRRGYDLLVAAENTELFDAAGKIQELGAEVTPVQVDLAEYEGVEKLYKHINSMSRPVSVIAINAGVGVGGDFTRETELDAELNLIRLNVISTVHLAKRVLKDMVERDSGGVLFTASVASVAPGPFEAVYAASKAFVFSFSEALRNELKETNVTITALMPGATETNFFHRAGMDDTKIGKSKKDDPAGVAREGIDALMAGKDRVVAGSFKNKVFAAAGGIAPETAAQMPREQAKPGSGNKR